MKKKERELRKQLKRAEKEKEKYGYILNKIPEEYHEGNIFVGGISYCGYYNTYKEVYDEYSLADTLDTIKHISFIHYVLGKNMIYPPELISLVWSFEGYTMINTHTGKNEDMEECGETNDVYELPVLPNTIEKLYINYINLKPIEILPNVLTKLEITYSNLKYLPELPETLKFLICTGNGLVELPILPDGLCDLLCYTNQLTYLPELPKSLCVLWCGGNLIKKMPDSIVNLLKNKIKTRRDLEMCFKWTTEMWDIIEKICNFDLAMLLKCQKAVEIIENQYMEAKYNPKYQYCRNRLKNEFDEIYEMDE